MFSHAKANSSARQAKQAAHILGSTDTSTAGQAAPGSTFVATQQERQNYSSRRTCRVAIHVEPDIPRTGERSSKQSNTGGGANVLCRCTLLYREPGNTCCVLLHTVVQGVKGYLRWLYRQRTCLVCVPHMTRLRLQPGDKLLPIAVK